MSRTYNNWRIIIKDIKIYIPFINVPCTHSYDIIESYKTLLKYKLQDNVNILVSKVVYLGKVSVL